MRDLNEQGTLRSHDGLNIFFRREIPRHPKGVVILLHSLGEHSGRYDGAAAAFRASGYSVYRFDCRGHGLSDGPRGDVRDFQDYVMDTDMIVDHARTAYPGLPLFLIGHSMGAFVAAAYASLHPDKLDGEVTTAAAVQLLPALDFLNESCQHRHRERGDERFSLLMPDRQTGEEPWSDSLMLDSVTIRLAGNVWLQGADWFAPRLKQVVTPMLILHGEDDGLVPLEASRWFYDGISSEDRSLRTYPHQGHALLAGTDSVIDDIIGWLDVHRGAILR